MSVRVSRRLLEAALAGLNEAAAPPSIDTATDYDTLVKALDAAPDGAVWNTPDIDGVGSGFTKSRGTWKVDTQFSSDQLGQILAPSGEEKLAKADKRGQTDLSLDATDFVVPIGKGVNFVRDAAGGVWRDNTPIESKMLAAYKFKDQMGAVMPERLDAGKRLRAVKDEDFMFVLDQSTLDFYIMDAANDPADPLGSMERLFTNATVNTKFIRSLAETKRRAKELSVYVKSFNPPPTKPKAFSGDDEKKTTYKKYVAAQEELGEITSTFTDLATFVDRPEAFTFSMDFLKGGKIEDAMKSARTIFGAFFDIFTGADLRMEFVFTEFGPAFRRRQQLISKLTGSKTALSDSDFRKFEGTDYFEVVDLPKADGTYKFGTDPVTVSSDQKPAVAEKTVDLIGVTIAENSYGWAYVLYLLGMLTRSDAEAAAAEPAAPPAPGPATPPEDPAAKVKKYVEDSIVGKPLGDGALFFDFNATTPRANVDPNPEAYYNNVAQAVRAHVDEIKKILGDSGVKPTNSSDIKRWFDVTLIGTADPIGTTSYNDPLSKNRIGPSLKEKIEAVAGSSENMYYVFTKELGENPWTDYKKIDNNTPKTGVHENLRFVKAYGDSTQDSPDATYFKWAQDFARTKLTNLEAFRESRDITRLRDQIRQILRERVTRHE